MIQHLLLDLDNTLYPRSSGLGLYMGRRMADYIVEHLNVSRERAQELRREGLARHGTTLRWLMVEHGMTEVERFLDYVHPENLGEFLTEEHRATAQHALRSIDLPASILTNSPREHAARVLGWLGLEHRFDHVFDIRLNQMKGKPHRSAYYQALRTMGAKASETLYADDVLEYVLPFRDLGGYAYLVGEAAEPQSGVGSMPSIAELAETVSELRSG